MMLGATPGGGIHGVLRSRSPGKGSATGENIHAAEYNAGWRLRLTRPTLPYLQGAPIA